MFTYQSYLEENDSITFQHAEEIYTRILSIATKSDMEFNRLWKIMIENAINYSNMRAKYSLQTLAERSEMFDTSRTTNHNVFMYSLEDVVFYMKEKNWNTDWFDQIGTIKNDRKRFGDFACYLVFIYSLNAR